MSLTFPGWQTELRTMHCRNCGEPIFYGRWCVDCVRAVAKILLLQGIAAAAIWGKAWLLSHLHL